MITQISKEKLSDFFGGALGQDLASYVEENFEEFVGILGFKEFKYRLRYHALITEETKAVRNSMNQSFWVFTPDQ